MNFREDGKVRAIEHRLILVMLFAGLLACMGCEKTQEYQPVNLGEVSQEQTDGHTNENSGIQDVKQAGEKPLRVAVAAMVSPKQTLVYYEDLLAFIGEKTGHAIDLVQRKTYAEVNELFSRNLIDLAFVCSGPYANARPDNGFEALATPVVRGKPYYQSYLIVQKNAPYQSLDDLKDKIFAFTDPDSNSGALVPRYWLLEKNTDPARFFSRITYTYSHDNSILAVARGLVDGAAVDGHIWDYYDARNPYLTSKTRVIKKSADFGSPPLVASVSLDPGLKNDIQQTMITMHLSEKGKKILNPLMIDQFVVPRDIWYESIQTMQAALRQSR
jgi:phosphonate transport system substrate-binding protein